MSWLRRPAAGIAVLVAVVLVVAGLAVANTGGEVRSGGKPRSVIYFRGDGMGTQEITAARRSATAILPTRA
jgi:alkaline phosphatase